MSLRRVGLVLAAVVVVGALLWPVGPWAEPRPELTIENGGGGGSPAEVTAITTPNLRTAMLTNFEATNRSGHRRLVTVEQLVWPEGYRNLTLVDDVASQHWAVDPGENLTTTVEPWEQGDVTVYVIEAGPNQTNRRTRVITCRRTGQVHELTVEGAGVGSFTRCA